MIDFARRQVVTAALALATTAQWTSPASAQIRRAPTNGSSVSVSVDLKVGSDTVAATGTGQCTHAPQASIYNVRSQLWSVRHDAAPGKAVQLSLWRPADGSADMFTLSVGTITVSTVRGGQAAGSGTATFEPSGNGGSFRIDAKSANGQSISGSITCQAFTPHIAEGG